MRTYVLRLKAEFREPFPCPQNHMKHTEQVRWKSILSTSSTVPPVVGRRCQGVSSGSQINLKSSAASRDLCPPTCFFTLASITSLLMPLLVPLPFAFSFSFGDHTLGNWESASSKHWAKSILMIVVGFGTRHSYTTVL
jgi:hypothetical protein